MWLKICNELRNSKKLQLSRVKTSVSVLCIVNNLAIYYVLYCKSQKVPSPFCGFRRLCKSSFALHSEWSRLCFFLWLSIKFLIMGHDS